MNQFNSVITLILLLAALPQPSLAAIRLLSGNAAGAPFFNGASAAVIAASPGGRHVLTDTLVLVDLATDSTVAAGVRGDGSTAGYAVAASVSEGGRHVAWVEQRSGRDVYWRNRDTGVTRNITAGADGACDYPQLSADGRLVLYVSQARNLAADPSLLPPAGRWAVLLYDSADGSTRVVSLTHDGKALDKGLPNPRDAALCAEGRYVFYATDAANAHPERRGVANTVHLWLYRRNLADGAVDVVNRAPDGSIPSGSFSLPRPNASGHRVSFRADFVGSRDGGSLSGGYTNPLGADIYLKDLIGGHVHRITRTIDGSVPDGLITDHALGGNGEWVAFQSSGRSYYDGETDPPKTGTTEGAFDAFRADIAWDGSVAVTWLTRPPGAVVNILSRYIAAPVSGGYCAIMTGQWQHMLGQPYDPDVFEQTIGIGSFDFSGAQAPGLWAGAADRGDGWWQLGWFGFFRIAGPGPGLIYHYHLGWLYAGGAQASLWLYMPGVGWTYTSEAVFPFLYAAERGNWIYYLRWTLGPRWFYDYASAAWFTL